MSCLEKSIIKNVSENEFEAASNILVSLEEYLKITNSRNFPKLGEKLSNLINELENIIQEEK